MKCSICNFIRMKLNKVMTYLVWLGAISMNYQNYQTHNSGYDVDYKDIIFCVVSKI